MPKTHIIISYKQNTKTYKEMSQKHRKTCFALKQSIDYFQKDFYKLAKKLEIGKKEGNSLEKYSCIFLFNMVYNFFYLLQKYLDYFKFKSLKQSSHICKMFFSFDIRSHLI